MLGKNKRSKAKFKEISIHKEAGVLKNIYEYEKVFKEHEISSDPKIAAVEKRRMDRMISVLNARKLNHLKRMMSRLSPNVLQFIKDTIKDLYGDDYSKKSLPDIEAITGIITDYSTLEYLFNEDNVHKEDDVLLEDKTLFDEAVMMTLERLIMYGEPILLEAIDLSYDLRK